MRQYDVDSIRFILTRNCVQNYLSRRKQQGGLCVGGCGTEVPPTKDASLWHSILFALGRIDISEFLVEPTFLRREDHGNVRCLYEHKSFQNWIDPARSEYDQEAESVYKILSTRPIVLREGIWVLGEKIT